MLYLNPRLKAGPHLRTVLAHEYTHAITFCEHVLNNPPECRRDEEGWISEGLAHVVEDLHQHGWSNLDYRVRAYLAQPERYPLAVSDYFTSGLWRTAGTEAAQLLFMRWCSMPVGTELARNMLQSPFVGTRNLELATQQSFSKLYRDWAVSLVQNDSWRKDQPLPDRIAREQGAGNREQGAGNREQGAGNREQGAGNREQGTGNRELRLFGPAFHTLNEGAHEFTLAGTGLKYILVPGGNGSNQRLRIQSDREARLQVTLVEIDPRRGLLDVSCQVVAEDNRLIVEAKALGSPVRLEGLAFEKVPPDGTGLEGTGYHNLADRPTTPLIGTGEIWTATFAHFLPADRRHDLLVRVLGKDSQGRDVVGCGFIKGTGTK